MFISDEKKSCLDELILKRNSKLHFFGWLKYPYDVVQWVS